MVTGIIIALLLVLLISVVGRVFLFLRLISTLLLLAILVFAGILGYRYYIKERLD